jgi:hypothetical protein
VVTLSDVTAAQDRSADILHLEGAIPIAGEPGTHRLDIDIPGAGRQNAYVELLK